MKARLLVSGASTMTFGSNQKASRREIVALHGFLGLPSDWLHVFDPSFQSEFKIYTPDLWRSAKNLYSADGFNSWCREFSSSEFFERKRELKPILVGYSMGGRLAMHAALKEPERWAGVVLISAHPGLMSNEERCLRVKHDQGWAGRFRADPWNEVIEAWNAQTVLQPPSVDLAPGAICLDRQDESSFDREALASAMEFWSLGCQKDLRGGLSRLSLPLWYITGALDTKFTNLIKDLKLSSFQRHVVVENAGHRVPWDQPEKVREHLRAFANSL